MSDWLLFRSNHNSCMGIEFAKTHPWLLEDNEIERFNEAMGRPKGSTNGSKKVEAKPASQLLAALKFIEIAAKSEAVDFHKHVVFQDGYLIASNGTVTAGFPVDEPPFCAPNYKLFVKSLSKTGKELNMVLLENNSLSIKGENIRAIVPCFPLEDMPKNFPDSPIVPINNELKKAFEVCAIFTNEDGDRVLETSILLRGNDCTGSDGKCIMQYWHGIDLPPNLIIPVTFIKGVLASTYDITSFGWTEGHSITFYFQGGMWIKTLLYGDKWPDCDQLFSAQFNASEFPPSLLEGVDAVDDFSDNHTVYLKDNNISSHNNDAMGATYDVPGLQGGKKIDPKYLKKLLPYAKKIDYTTAPDRIYFEGENLRGIILAKVTQ